MSVGVGIAVYCGGLTVAQPAEVATWCVAINAAMPEFCDYWSRLPIAISFYGQKSGIPAGMPAILISDVCDDPQALAYHTESVDRVTGLVGAKTCLDAGESACSALAHEAFEAAIDPWCNGWTQTETGILICTEVCDPVQDQSFRVNSLEISSYVLPAWFDSQDREGPYDHGGVLTAPFTRTKGGYFVTMKASGTTQSEGMRTKHKPLLGRGAARLGHTRVSGAL